MRTIETTITVTDRGILSGRAPIRIRPGRHRAVIVLDESDIDAARPAPMPDLTVFRRNLGCATYRGNSVVKYREDERT